MIKLHPQLVGPLQVDYRLLSQCTLDTIIRGLMSDIALAEQNNYVQSFIDRKEAKLQDVRAEYTRRLRNYLTAFKPTIERVDSHECTTKI